MNSKKIKIDFTALKKEKSPNFAETTFNFDCSLGELKPGMGIKNLSVCYDGVHTKTFVVNQDIAKILNSYVYEYYDPATRQYSCIILFYVQKTNDEKAFYYALFDTFRDDLRQLNNLSFSSEPVVVKLYAGERDYLLFVPTNTQDSTCVWTNASASTSQNLPPSVDACFYDGKVYAIPKANSHRLFITSNTSPSTLISSQFNGDYLDFSDGLGNFVCLKVFNGSMYAFREKGITKITSTNCGENFSYKTITFDLSKIFKNTIEVCDDKILMLGFDGIYAFDGIDFQKYEFGFEHLISEKNEYANSVFQNGTYFLSLNLEDKTCLNEMPCTGLLNNSVISISENNIVKIMRGASVKSMISLNYKQANKLMLCFDDANVNKIGEICFDGGLFSSSTTKMWESFEQTLSNGQSIIKSLSLSGNGQFEIKIFVDGKSYVYNVLLSKINKKINMCLKGRRFKFSYKSETKNAQICDAVLEVVC